MKKQPRLSVVLSPAEEQRLQRAWTRSGTYATRSAFVRDALNAFAGEEIFTPDGEA